MGAATDLEPRAEGGVPGQESTKMAAAEGDDAQRISALEAQLAAKDAQLEKLQLHIVELELEATPEKSAPTEWVSPTSKGVGNKSCFFQRLDDLFRSKDFTVYAANELDKAYCVLEGCVHTPIDEFQRERIACCWASIPAADAVAHQMAFQYMTRRQDAEQSDDEEQPSFDRADSLSMLDDANAYIEKQGKEGIMMIEQDYLEGLRDLTSSQNLSCEQVFLAVNCAHLAFRSGLPFREMASSDYGPLLCHSRNKPVCHITQLDREKSFTLICKAAQLILLYLDQNHQDDTKEATDVFLGGSCNPTTWRRDTAIPQLEAAGTTYYNPQVDDWSPDLVEIEAQAKQHANILLFVIDAQTRALASMLEASEYIAAGRKVVLIVEEVEVGCEIAGTTCDVAEAKDLNRARSYLRDVATRHGAPVHETVVEAIDCVIAMAKQD